MFKQFTLIPIITILLASFAFAEKGSFRISVFPAPPDISASVKFTEPSGNKILDAEETGQLTVTINNTGKGDAFNVSAEIQIDKRTKGLEFKRKVNIGTIASGKKITKKVHLKAAENIRTADVRFTIETIEANGFDADLVGIAFSTKAFEPPKLIVADIGIDDQNGNSRVEPLENVKITVRVQNMGYGDARGVEVDVINGKNVYIGGEGKTHFNIGDLRAGEHKDISLIFYTNKRIKNGERIPLEVKISEQRPQFQIAKALDLKMNKRQKRTEEIVVEGIHTTKDEIKLAGGLSVDVDMKIPKGKKAGKDDIAVVIGNKDYSASGLPHVDYAYRDAKIIREYLMSTFGFRPDNIIYEEDATLSKFNEIFGTRYDHDGKLNRFIKKGVSNVFIYYVGHGAPDINSGEAYFVPVDANPQYIATNGYKLQTFYDNLSKVPAKNITIVLDSCFSGNSAGGMLFKNISPATLKVKKNYKGPENATIITSAAVDQVSSWYPEKKHSLFTYYFLKGLQGNADADNNKRITTGEMKEYLGEHVPYMAMRLNGNKQDPVIVGGDEEVLVSLK